MQICTYGSTATQLRLSGALYARAKPSECMFPHQIEQGKYLNHDCSKPETTYGDENHDTEADRTMSQVLPPKLASYE